MLQGLYTNSLHLLKHNPSLTANNGTKYQARAVDICLEEDQFPPPGLTYSTLVSLSEIEKVSRNTRS